MNNNNPELRPHAQSLRRNMTDAERRLWYAFLRDFPLQFKRQRVVGRYILDFYCPAAGIAVELDGDQHYSEAGLAKDEARDAFLQSEGILVLRYGNAEIHKHFRYVCEDIRHQIELRLGLLPGQL